MPFAGNRRGPQQLGSRLHDTPKGKEGNVKRFWTALAIAAVIGAALFLLAAADAGASRTLSAAFLV
jgi:hypothetical protein